MNLKLEAITVIRKGVGSYVAGRWVTSSDTSHDADGNIQPLTGTELQQLPEGDRDREALKIYTAFALINGDVVTRENGVQYETQAVKDWSAFKQPHYKARLMRIEGQ